MIRFLPNLLKYPITSNVCNSCASPQILSCPISHYAYCMSKRDTLHRPLPSPFYAMEQTYILKSKSSLTLTSQILWKILLQAVYFVQSKQPIIDGLDGVLYLLCTCRRHRQLRGNHSSYLNSI